MTRISLSTVGSRGDVQPFCALGVGLLGAGFDVVVATHEPFRSLVEGYGLGFAPLPGDPRTVLQTPSARRLLAGGVGPIRFARRFLGLLEPWFDDLREATAPVVEKSDAVVYTPLAFTAWHQAEAARVPTALATLQPLEPTSAFATVASPRFDLGPFNALSHHVVRQLFWQPFRSRVNRWRVRELGLAPLPFSGPYGRLDGPILCGFSSALVGRPADWPEDVVVTGAWQFANAEALAPEVSSFLDAGDPPIYVGFGSLVIAEPDQLADVAVRAARATGYRLVLDAGWAGLRPEALDDEVLIVDGARHRDLFPRMAAVCHHGGAGTTHTASAAGVPQIVAPSYADQPFWGEVVSQRGSGLSVGSPGALSSERLARAIRAATRPATRKEAVHLAAEIAAERGVENAVEVLARHVARLT